MNTTFEHNLRARAEASVPTSLYLDMPGVLAAGRRRRTSRIGVTLGLLGALVVGGVALADIDLAPPAPSAAGPHTLGDAVAVELSPGVLAANRLVEQHTADGHVWWDTGLVPYGSARARYGFAAATGDELASRGGPLSGLAGVSLGLYTDGGGPPEVMPDIIAWHREPSPLDPATPLTGWSGYGDESATVWNLAGHVSARVPSAQTILLVPSGLSDGRTHLELPTVVSPVDPGAHLFAVTVTQAKRPPAQTDGFRPVVVFVGSDGSVDLNGECDQMTVESCSQMFGGGLIPALLSAGANLDR